jgi:hypothetical protein
MWLSPVGVLLLCYQGYIILWAKWAAAQGPQHLSIDKICSEFPKLFHNNYFKNIIVDFSVNLKANLK